MGEVKTRILLEARNRQEIHNGAENLSSLG